MEELSGSGGFRDEGGLQTNILDGLGSEGRRKRDTNAAKVRRGGPIDGKWMETEERSEKHRAQNIYVRGGDSRSFSPCEKGIVLGGEMVVQTMRPGGRRGRRGVERK